MYFMTFKSCKYYNHWSQYECGFYVPWQDKQIDPCSGLPLLVRRHHSPCIVSTAATNKIGLFALMLYITIFAYG